MVGLRQLLVHGVIFYGARNVYVVDLDASGYHLHWEQNEDDVEIDIGQHLVNVIAPVFLLHVMSRSEARPLFGVGCQRDGLFTPLACDFEGLSRQGGIDCGLVRLRLEEQQQFCFFEVAVADTAGRDCRRCRPGNAS